MWNQFETSLGKLGLLFKRFKFDGGRSGRDISALELKAPLNVLHVSRVNRLQIGANISTDFLFCDVLY